METRLIEPGHIEHVQLLQLGKVFLLLVERKELLVKLPAMNQRTKDTMPIEELSKASWDARRGQCSSSRFAQRAPTQQQVSRIPAGGTTTTMILDVVWA
jgi:hypothetical protein